MLEASWAQDPHNSMRRDNPRRPLVRGPGRTSRSERSLVLVLGGSGVFGETEETARGGLGGSRGNPIPCGCCGCEGPRGGNYPCVLDVEGEWRPWDVSGEKGVVDWLHVRPRSPLVGGGSDGVRGLRLRGR